MNLTHIAADLAATVDEYTYGDYADELSEGAGVDSTVIRNLDGYDRLYLDPEVLMLSSGEQAVIRSAQRLQLIGLDLDYLDDRYQRAVAEAFAKAAAALNVVAS